MKPDVQPLKNVVSIVANKAPVRSFSLGRSNRTENPALEQQVIDVPWVQRILPYIITTRQITSGDELT